MSPLLTEGARSVLTVSGSLAARSAYGGTAPARVREQLASCARRSTADECLGVVPAVTELPDGLPRSFFDRPSLEVARDLLGRDLAHREVVVRLTEVEAYAGPEDPASHAYRGVTPRNAVMFGPPGFLYVYFSYGVHWCANVVCGPDGFASAVLLRAGVVVGGLEVARSRRVTARNDAELARGPAGSRPRSASAASTTGPTCAARCVRTSDRRGPGPRLRGVAAAHESG